MKGSDIMEINWSIGHRDGKNLKNKTNIYLTGSIWITNFTIIIICEAISNN